MGKKYTCIKLVTQTIENIRKKKFYILLKKKRRKMFKRIWKISRDLTINFFNDFDKFCSKKKIQSIL